MNVCGGRSSTSNRSAGELEAKMYEHAKNLEFEQAAQVRDQLQKLRTHIIDV